MVDAVFVSLLVVVATFIYVFHLLKQSPEYSVTRNSIDAFIIKDDSNEKRKQGKGRKVSNYKTDYSTEGRQVLIVFGTEYGCSEEVAKLLYDRIQAMNGDQSTAVLLQPRVINARDYKILDLSREQIMFVVISTSGDGVPPTDARPFCDFISSPDISLSHLRFSVLALGDSNYPQYCRTGKTVHESLVLSGGECVVARHDVDMEDWSVINKWLDTVNQYLATAHIEPGLDYIQHSDISEDKHSRHRPFMATLKEKYLLTVCNHHGDKETIHCEFDITGSDLTWTSGDALGIFPKNNPPEVDRLLKAMKCDDSQMVEKPPWAYEEEGVPTGGTMSVSMCLQKYYDLKSVKHDLLLNLEEHVTSDEEQSCLGDLLRLGVSKSNTQLSEYLQDREVADVLSDFPSHMLPWQRIFDCMKSLQPRYYSISSSPRVDLNKVCVTAAVVRYELAEIPRTGVTTTFLHDRLAVLEKCPVFMSRNPDFRLPNNSSVPVILIGPGTGIAPFMAFIQERAMDAERGRVLLYFGCRHRNQDFLYQKQLEKWSADGTIHLSVAFSRDQASKVYVQDLLLKDRKEIWTLLDKDMASIYVCGDAKHMAHDVHKALMTIVQDEGYRTESEAVTYLQSLEASGRYQKDVWVV